VYHLKKKIWSSNCTPPLSQQKARLREVPQLRAGPLRLRVQLAAGGLLHTQRLLERGGLAGQPGVALLRASELGIAALLQVQRLPCARGARSARRLGGVLGLACAGRVFI